MLRAREATRPEVQMMCEGRPNEDGMQRRGNMQDDATKMDDDELMLDGVGTRSMKRLRRRDDHIAVLFLSHAEMLAT